MRRDTFFVAVFAVCFASPLVCTAQFGNSGGGGGGGSGFGGGGSTGSGFGGGGGTGSGFGGGGSGFGNSGSGSGLGGGMSGSGFGNNSSGFGNTGSGFGQTGANGQNGTQAGFLGRNTQNNQQNNFLGRNTQNQGQGGQTGMQNLGGNNRGRNNNRNNQNNINNQQQNGGMGRGQVNQLPPIRPRQRIAFEHPKPQLALVSTGLENRINRVGTLPGANQAGSSLKGITLSVDAGVVVLKGKASSRQDAKLAENLARLEPGVSSVRNEIEYPDPTEE